VIGRRTIVTGTGLALLLGCAGFVFPDDGWPQRRRGRKGASAEAVPREGTLREIDEMFDGRMRRSTVYLPSRWEKGESLPLVLVAHGSQGNGRTMYERRGWAATCERAGYVGVFPDTGAEIVEGDPDDAYFAHALTRAAESYGTDPRRAYVVGFSGGGKKIYHFAAVHSAMVAGAAVHSGTIGYREDDPAPWDPRRTDFTPLSLFHLHGAKDDRVPPQGGVFVPPDGVPRYVVTMEEALIIWSQALHATPVEPPPIPELPRGSLTRMFEAPGGQVVLGALDPTLGHDWAPYANEVIVRFFERTPPKPIPTVLPAGG
jgi:poly(3-hydroxybutyrate) depolymerase